MSNVNRPAHRYHLWFYVPEADKERVKSALFEAGAGTIGNYRRCSWETLGTGQFMPIPGSDPAIGVHDRLESVEEYRVEMIVPAADLAAVLSALQESHSYEEPVYGVIKSGDY